MTNNNKVLVQEQNATTLIDDINMKGRKFTTKEIIVELLTQKEREQISKRIDSLRNLRSSLIINRNYLFSKLD